MNRLAMILAVVILPAWVLPAPADGIFGFFGKKTKVDPAQRVPELIATLKTEQDERKRASAATELGSFDTAAFAEIVPVLIDVLQHDTKTGVRMDAASSLGGIRPISQVAGDALEKASSSDDNWRVRLHVKGIVMRYRMAGYSPGSKANPAGSKTGEPPLLATGKQQAVRQGPPAPGQFPTGSNGVANTSATKISTARGDDTPEFRPSLPRPLPQGPVFSTAIPQETMQPAPSALPMVNSEGPPLTPFPPPAPRGQTPAPPLPGGPPLSVPPPF